MDNLPDYDFSFLTPETFAGDKRINLRVVRCCGNCSNFKYERHKPRRAYCGLGKKKAVNRRSEGPDWDDILNNWPRVHFTCCCDRHSFRNIVKGSQHKRISEWVGKTFLEDGTLEENM